MSFGIVLMFLFLAIGLIHVTDFKTNLCEKSGCTVFSAFLVLAILPEKHLCHHLSIHLSENLVLTTQMYLYRKQEEALKKVGKRRVRKK